MRRALLSTFDKRGIVEFATGLAELGFEVISTGGTARALTEAGVAVTPVSDVTGVDEILSGRVKTLHPAVHAGILANRAEPEHVAELERRGIALIDVVAVNLYPFAETVASGAGDRECIEMIDIGGPTMIRAAAKNHHGVWVVVDPEDYDRVLEALAEGHTESTIELRRRLANRAFDHTAAYDRQIADWMAEQDADMHGLPPTLQLTLEREMEPRYGENPHQKAAVYRLAGEKLLGGMQQLQGKHLSYNNFLDLDAARTLVHTIDEPAVVIVKHNNPCGAGLGDDPTQAYERALACDPVSAFGSVVGVNRPIDQGVAETMRELFIEVVVAPAFDAAALEVFASKANLRLILAPAPVAGRVGYRSIDGGLLAQESDDVEDRPDEWTTVTERHPSNEEMRALKLAWTVCRAVRSNAIVLANDRQTVGIGAGQMSRVDSCRIAIDKAVLDVARAAAASDAFFPFADGVETLAAAGVTAIIQPGGSRRDDEVIAAANRLGLAMLTTGRRHFRH